MSILKNILGAFVEFKEGNEPEPQKVNYQKEVDRRKTSSHVAEDVAKNNVGTGAVVSTPTASAEDAGSLMGAGYQKHFDELLEEANSKNPFFKGTDFKEFVESKADVEAIADEATKYRTAFNVLKRTGLTKERLVTTGNEYLNIIDRDIKAFEGVFEQQYRADVEHKEQLLQQKSQELQALNERIAALNQDVKKISQDVGESKNKLTANRNAFVLAGEHKKKEIKTELEKIDQYF